MSTTKKHILHLEDNKDFHVYVNTILGDIVDVSSFCTAKEAREALSGIKFDLFLLDLVLQDGSGATIAKQLKHDYPNIPIVILSAHDIVVGFVEEADATFVKTTLDFDEFTETIKQLLNIS